MNKIVNYLKTQNDFVVICSDSIKQQIIKELSTCLIKGTYKSYSEFQQDIFGHIDNKMIFDQNNTHEIYEVTKIKLTNALYLLNETPESFFELHPNLQELSNLIKNNHLRINKSLLNYYQKKKIILINYFNQNDLVNIALNKLINKAEYLFTNKINQSITIHELTTINLECGFVVNEISKLLLQGIDPQKIHIQNVSDEYKLIFKEIFCLYHIDYDFNETKNLIDYEYIKDFMTEVYSTNNGKFNDFYQNYLENHHHPLIDELTKALNVLCYYDYDMNSQRLKNQIFYILSNKTYQTQTLTNVIKFENVFENIYNEDDYIFILNFNQDVLPHSFQDKEYLSDEIRKELGLLQSIDRSNIDTSLITHFILSYQNIFITCQENQAKSSIINNLIDQVIIKKEEFLLNEVTSKEYARMRYLFGKEKFLKFREITSDLEVGYFSFKDDYPEYNNTFTGIDSLSIDKYTNNLVLSYSSLDDYFRCPFLYYLKYILKLFMPSESIESNNSIFIGSLYHYVLQNLVNDTFLLNKPEKDIYERIRNLSYQFISDKNIQITNKVNFYMEKLGNELTNTYIEIAEAIRNSQFTVYSLEKEFKYQLDEHTQIKGFIDLILKNENYYVVIDYKTHNVSVNWQNLDKGLEMQLPIYLYLISLSDKDALYGGAYLQSVIHNTPFRADKKNYDEQFADSLKYAGYTNVNPDVIKMFNEKSLPLIPFDSKGEVKDTFRKKAFNDYEFKELNSFTANFINHTINKIKKGEFNFKPFTIGNEFSSCSYCPYIDICNIKQYQITSYPKGDSFPFIKKDGDSNEME